MFESNNTPFTMPVMPANSGYGNNGAWGDDGAWWIIIFVLFFAFGGWGGNGWGGNGSNSSYYTDSALQRGFDTQSIIGKLDGINNGLCDGFYAVNNGMLTGFNGVNTNILQTGYGIQQAINADTVGGQGDGKKQIAEYRPGKGYRDGLAQGKINLARELANIADKHLVISLKPEKQNNSVSQRQFVRFMELLHGEKDGESNE